MVLLLRIAPYAMTLILGSALAFTRDDAKRRTLTVVFIAFVVGAQIVAGFTQRDLWPYSAFPVITESASRSGEAVWYEVRAVGGDGSEGRLDPSPLTDSAVEKWFERAFPVMSTSQRDAASRFLLRNSGRCPNDRFLGGLAAPDWLTHRPPLQRQKPVTLRVYRCDPRSRTKSYEFQAE